MYKKKINIIILLLFTPTLIQASEEYKIYSNSMPKLFSNDQDNGEKVIGPEAFIDMKRVPSQSPFPFFADWASGDVGKFKVNFGQNEFKGDAKGYKPFDSDYSPSRWMGSGEVSDDVITPENLGIMFYNRYYGEGKYYYEAQFLSEGSDNGIAHALGLISDGEASSSRLREEGITLAYLGEYEEYTYIYREDYWGYEEEGVVNQWSSYNILSGDWIQVWVDYDNDRVYIKKLGALKSEHFGIIDP